MTPPRLPRSSAPPPTDRETLVRDALSRGWFHGASIRQGLVPRPVRIAVHTLDGREYFLVVVHHRGPITGVDAQTPIDVVPLGSGIVVERYLWLGRTVGFRMRANGESIAVRVAEPETWIRWLEHPERPVTLRIT